MAPRRAPPPTDPNPQNWGVTAPPPQTPFLSPAEIQSQALADFEEPEETDVDRVSALLQQASTMARAEVKIYKIENGQSVYCQSFSPVEFEEGGYDMLRDSFGAGRFKIMLYGSHPITGKFGILARQEITIAESRRASPVATNNNDAMSTALQAIADGQTRLMQVMIEQRNTPPTDPMLQMGQMLGLMTNMRTAMGLDGQQRPQNSITEIVGAIQALKGAAAEFAPAEKEDTSLLSLAGQVLPLIQQGMQRQSAPPEYSGNPLPVITPPASFNAAPASAQAHQTNPIQPPHVSQEEIMKQQQLIELKNRLAELIIRAKNNANQDESARFVYDELPDEFVEILDSEGWFEMLCMVESEARQYQPWFTSVRDKFIALLDAEDAAQNTTVLSTT